MEHRTQILIVDDDPAMLRATSRLLQSADYEVLEAANGETGWELIREHRAQLVLLDRVLPDVDGVEICRRIKADPALADTFVVLISGLKTSSASQVDGLDAGADGYITRPISNQELLARVRAMARIKKAEDALRASEARFRSLFENAVLGLYRTTPKGRILMANPALVRMLGFDSFQALAQRNLDQEGFAEGASRAGFKKQLERYGRVTGWESTWIRQDGTSLVVRESATAIRDRAGNTLFYEGTVEDITERVQAEKALRESEQKFRSTFEHAAIGMCLGDTAGRVITANRSLGEILGYSVRELEGKNLEELTHPDDLEISRKRAHQLLDGEMDSYRFEKRYLHQDGHAITAAVGTFLLRDAQGAPLYFITHIQDITDRVLAEQKLRQYAERLRALHAIDGIILATSSPQKIAQAALRHIRRLVPCYRASVATLDPESSVATLLAVHTDDRRTIGAGRSVPIETFGDLQEFQQGKVHVVKDVSTLENLPPLLQSLRDKGLRAFVSVPLIARGRLIGALTLGMEQTGRFSLEHVDIAREVANQIAVALNQARLRGELEGERQRLEAVVAHLPEGILLLDPKYRIVLSNPMADSFLSVLTDAHEDDCLENLGGQPVETLLASPEAETWHELKVNGSQNRVFEMSAQPIGNGAGVAGWVLVIREVTREREIQERIQQQERLAAVGQLAAGIAHDFNNIMASIVLYAGILQRSSNLSSSEQERVRVISQQGHRASELVQQILDFSRQSVIARKPLDLAPFLKELSKLLARTLPENIDIDLAYNLDGYTINADPTRIQQVIMNLAVNARDAMPKGGELRMRLERVQVRPGETPPLPEMGAGEWVCVTISDTGTGIPAEVLPHVFEPFFTTKKSGQGTGLGLAQVYGIIVQHKGHISVESKEGEGTTFTLYLPALLQFEATPELPGAPTLPEGQGEMILVVEDDDKARVAMAEVIESLGYRVLTAPNGEAAVNLFERDGQEIALVLSDLVMPKMDGTTLHATLREKYPWTQMIVTTGYPLEDGGKELLEHGITDWIAKPFSADQIAQKVQAVLGGA